MPNTQLNSAALGETARTLAITAGIETPKAIGLLNRNIYIHTGRTDPSTTTFASVLELLMKRTFVSAGQVPVGEPDLEIVIGSSISAVCKRVLFVGWSAEEIVISKQPITISCEVNTPPIWLTIGACYAAAAATKALTTSKIGQPLPDPLVVHFDSLGIEREWLSHPLVLSDTYQAGCGAIGNGFLYALRQVEVQGRLHVVDPDVVDDTNLQRQVLFEDQDIGLPKAERLVARAQLDLRDLELIAHNCRLQALRSEENDRWLRQLVVCVDSRRARRELQNEIAGEVFDASTTDIREIVIHHHRQPTRAACMSCVYYADKQEVRRDELIADGLGISVQQVRQPVIDFASATTIVAQLSLDVYPNDIVGLAYDTFFKQLCGEGLLRLTPDKQVLAPFAFVSMLAGTLLAIELIRRSASSVAIDDNYWRVSAWSSPQLALRQMRGRRSNCSFCGDPNMVRATRLIWGSVP